MASADVAMLDGVRVVELGQNLAGPFAGEILADLGADVVKIEKPGGGDDARGWGPKLTETASAIYHLVNRNKDSVVLDLKKSSDRAWLEELVANADVFVQNMRPGSLKVFGLDGDTLSAAYPRLIYCDMGAFGHVGPMRERTGYEPLMQAFAGLVSVNGHADSPPARMNASIVDLGTGMWAAIGILAALWRRAATGKGCVVNTSLLETALVWGGNHAASYSANGHIPQRDGSGHPMIVPYQAFETLDGPLIVAPGNDRLFKALAEALGHPEWPSDPRFATNELRRKNREAMITLVSDCFAKLHLSEAQHLLDEAGVPNAPIQTVPEVLEHPQIKALNLFQPAPDMNVPMVAMPVSFDGRRPPIRRAARELGIDTAARMARIWEAGD